MDGYEINMYDDSPAQLGLGELGPNSCAPFSCRAPGALLADSMGLGKTRQGPYWETCVLSHICVEIIYAK